MDQELVALTMTSTLYFNTVDVSARNWLPSPWRLLCIYSGCMDQELVAFTMTSSLYLQWMYGPGTGCLHHDSSYVFTVAVWNRNWLPSPWCLLCIYSSCMDQELVAFTMMSYCVFRVDVWTRNWLPSPWQLLYIYSGCMDQELVTFTMTTPVYLQWLYGPGTGCLHHDNYCIFTVAVWIRNWLPSPWQLLCIYSDCISQLKSPSFILPSGCIQSWQWMCVSWMKIS